MDKVVLLSSNSPSRYSVSPSGTEERVYTSDLTEEDGGELTLGQNSEGSVKDDTPKHRAEVSDSIWPPNHTDRFITNTEIEILGRRIH